MIHALHGNAGIPDDLAHILRESDHPFTAWHLWRFLDENPAAATLHGFAAAFQDKVNSLADTPRILLGYSLGARLALHVLTAFPQRWDAAILISPHPGLENETERAARISADQLWAVRFLREPWDEVMAAWNAQPVFSGESVPVHDQLLVETWRREVAFAFDTWSLGRQEDLRPRLPQVACPVLWLTGERDEKFTNLASSACALLPRGRHRILPGAGHRAHLDQPAATSADIRRFLKAELE